MFPHTLAYTLHLLAAVGWVGGMLFAFAVLRPASVAALAGPERLRLWSDVFRRFFGFVWLFVVIIPTSGLVLLFQQWRGLETAPRYVQWMIGGYLVMTALFMRLATLHLPRLRLAIEQQDWAEGAACMTAMRRLVACNLALGIVVIVIAAARPGLY